jgi:hypothetical protein
MGLNNRTGGYSLCLDGTRVPTIISSYLDRVGDVS